jgi:hypothetical protein
MALQRSLDVTDRRCEMGSAACSGGAGMGSRLMGRLLGTVDLMKHGAEFAQAVDVGKGQGIDEGFQGFARCVHGVLTQGWDWMSSYKHLVCQLSNVLFNKDKKSYGCLLRHFALHNASIRVRLF